MNTKIQKIVKSLVRKYRARTLEELAEGLNITIFKMPLDTGIAGCYKLLKRRKYVFLNNDIEDEAFLKVVLAHEIGHAVMHPKENCAFMKKHTLLLSSKLELQANLFSAYLLISDEMLQEYSGFTQEQFCQCTGYPKELIKLRLHG